MEDIKQIDKLVTVRLKSLLRRQRENQYVESFRREILSISDGSKLDFFFFSKIAKPFLFYSFSFLFKFLSALELAPKGSPRYLALPHVIRWLVGSRLGRPGLTPVALSTRLEALIRSLRLAVACGRRRWRARRRLSSISAVCGGLNKGHPRCEDGR